jgi:hypothetical protein
MRSHPSENGWSSLSKLLFQISLLGLAFLAVHAMSALLSRHKLDALPRIGVTQVYVPPAPSVAPAAVAAGLFFLIVASLLRFAVLPKSFPTGNENTRHRTRLILILCVPSTLLTFVIGAFFVLNLSSPWAALIGVGVGLASLPGKLAHVLWLRRYSLVLEKLERPAVYSFALKELKEMISAYQFVDGNTQTREEQHRMAGLASERLREIGKASDIPIVRELLIA